MSSGARSVELSADRFLQSAGLPGISGRIRDRLEDFVVEERPRYVPAGEGDHLYLWVEKRGLSSHELVRRLARLRGRSEREFGVAGLKDARAIARQWISLEHAKSEDFPAEPCTGVTILARSRHRNKLRKGHLVGNHFELTIRGTAAGDGGRARAILERLSSAGIPNAFGAQRFGRDGQTAALGRALLAGDSASFLDLLAPGWRGGAVAALKVLPRSERAARKALSSLRSHPGDLERALRAVPRAMRLLYAGAFQARLFNDVLGRRLAQPEQLEPGEVMVRHPDGAAFVLEDPVPERARRAALEIVPSGPMFGPKLKQPAPESRAARREAEVLAQGGLAIDAFAQPALGLRGQRRALLIPLEGWSLEEGEEDGEGVLRLGLSLPRGSYATVVLEELLRRGLR